MMTGMTIAQLIPIAVSPALTRLFSPEQFGSFALFLGLAAVLSIIATARYDLAIVLPEAEEDAVNVVALCMVLCLAVGFVGFTIVLAFGDTVAELMLRSREVTWLWLVPVMVILLGVNQTLGSWANRRKRYRSLAGNAIALQGSTAGFSVLLGLAKTSINGLILGRLVGQMTACVTLGWQMGRDFPWRAHRISAARMWEVGIRYRKFPLYNVPYSFIGAFSKEFLIVAFSFFGQLSAAGLWGLARTVLYVPITFLSNSLGQVFYKEATDHFGKPQLESLANRLMERIIDIFGPGFVLFAWWAPDLFAWIFGPTWREAGLFATIFSPAAFLFLFTSWPERIYVVAGRQDVQLYIQVISDFVIILTVAGLLANGVTPTGCVAVYSVLSVGYHAAYLIGVYRVAAFSLSALWSLLRRVAMVLGGFSVVFAVVTTFTEPAVLQFSLCVSVLVVYYAVLVYRERLVRG